MPLHDVFGGGGWELEGLEQLGLLRVKSAQSSDGLAVDLDAVLLDLAQECECRPGREWVTGGLELDPHHTVEDQGQEADQRVGADTLGQAVVDGGNLDITLEHPEAAIDISQ